ncbi:MAG: ABC transporter substrate-binding protein [Burkholderiales bacterium]|nr:ABC transporter substrate-binding protein [Phycisphaerae bacterium]
MFAIAIALTAPLARAQVTLQLNWKPEPQFGGFYTAQVEGYYKAEGLDVTVEAGGAGTPTVQMVAAGRVPYGIVSADELVIARARGLDVVALFAVYQTNPQGIMTRASRGFADIGDVFKQPGILAMQKGLPYALFLEKRYGFDKLSIVPSPFGDLTAYRTREAYAMQCFVTSEPLAAKKIGIEPKTFLIADSGYNPYTTVLVTRGEHLKSNEADVKRIVAAVAKGWRTYLDNPAKTNEFMAKLNPSMDAQTYQASADAQKPLIETEQTKTGGLGLMTLDRWKALIDQLVDLKVIEKPIDAAACFVSPK